MHTSILPVHLLPATHQCLPDRLLPVSHKCLAWLPSRCVTPASAFCRATFYLYHTSVLSGQLLLYCITPVSCPGYLLPILHQCLPCYSLQLPISSQQCLLGYLLRLYHTLSILLSLSCQWLSGYFLPVSHQCLSGYLLPVSHQCLPGYLRKVSHQRQPSYLLPVPHQCLPGYHLPVSHQCLSGYLRMVSHQRQLSYLLPVPHQCLTGYLLPVLHQSLPV
jgi:hypothetical protein